MRSIAQHNAVKLLTSTQNKLSALNSGSIPFGSTSVRLGGSHLFQAVLGNAVIRSRLFLSHYRQDTTPLSGHFLGSYSTSRLKFKNRTYFSVRRGYNSQIFRLTLHRIPQPILAQRFGCLIAFNGSDG